MKLAVKLKCASCNKIVNVKKARLKNISEKLGIDKDDLLKVYCCYKCRRARYRVPSPKELTWIHISSMPKLTPDFIEKYKDKVEWNVISLDQALPEWFIEKYRDKVNWEFVSVQQTLSEPFIEKYKDKVVWNYISHYQNLSPEFVVKYIDKITEPILYNSCYKTYPDSLKLILKQKFSG